ncbi:MAG TPA: bifunctional transaldolase/phosoglucose isomerase [Candidatus Acidoferrales bacterium]|nr:bifunctional transaldolase/phosoglucose isomerase [Candidatus Acidoferrales bacterium]
MNPETGARAKPRTANPIEELRRQGQSIWLDYIRRSLITSGELKRLIDAKGVTGMTSNPTIFDKAIAGSADYDRALAQLLGRDAMMQPRRLFEALAVEDIRLAAGALRPVWERSAGGDGYVSLEVAPELAHDTQGSVGEALRLWKLVDRPNLMIKIPATREGTPAIEALIGEGVNVNVTLMFSMAQYEAVAVAFLNGLAKCAHPERIASIASFFVSRVDSAVDKALAKLGTAEALALEGQIAIANSRQVYRRFQEIFHGEPFAPWRARGARVQRLLWASTSTKNPAYSDVLYVEELIGPDTVNTMPPQTLEAFADHGEVRGATIEQNLDRAADHLAALEKTGISLAAVAQQLLTEGVASFAESFAQLTATLDRKRTLVLSGGVDRQAIAAGPLDKAVQGLLGKWDGEGFGRRLWAKDYTLWSPTPAPEIVDRMGWLHLPEQMHEQAADLEEFREQIRKEGFTHAVVLGMGGSSLAPDVFQKTFGNAPGYPELIVLDSTHPSAVRAVEGAIDLKHTLFLVSSKSGTTTEPLSFFYYFWDRAGGAGRGRQFVAITDPGTPLEKLGSDRGFRRVFRAAADVGGRYSALTHFGLAPAALVGINLRQLLGRAWEMSEACAFCVPVSQNPGLELGALLGEAALARRDKLTFSSSPSMAPLAVWLEQLVAESTGKDGRGILPVAGEPLAEPALYGADRVFVDFWMGGEAGNKDRLAALEAAGHPVVRIRLSDRLDLAQEFFRWEIAVPAAGAAIGIQPFNQPDVQLAKDLARQAMKAGGGSAASAPGSDPVSAANEAALKRALEEWLGKARAGDYIALHAYLEPRQPTTAALESIRLALRRRTRLATTVGYGPRFLHSTGQLHKGGPNTGLFLQLVDDAAPDLPVPETDYSFGALIRAQALGDWQALTRRGRRVLRVSLGGEVMSGLERLAVLARG